MPRYRFTCQECESTRTIKKSVKNFDPKKPEDCRNCEGEMYYRLPQNLDSATYDKNKYTGKSKKQGLEKQVRKRMKKNMAKYEYQDMVDHHGINNTRHVIDKVDNV